MIQKRAIHAPVASTPCVQSASWAKLQTTQSLVTTQVPTTVSLPKDLFGAAALAAALIQILRPHVFAGMYWTGTVKPWTFALHPRLATWVPIILYRPRSITAKDGLVMSAVLPTAGRVIALYVGM